MTDESGRVSSPWRTYAEAALAQELREWSAEGSRVDRCTCVWDEARGRYLTICKSCAAKDKP